MEKDPLRGMNVDPKTAAGKSEYKLSLPISGMTCNGCVSFVEKAIQKLPGVSRVVVDLESNLADVVYDSKKVDLVELQQAVVDAGYCIPTNQVTLSVQGMNCISCVARVEGVLVDLPGVLEAAVNLTKATAQVTFVQGIISSLEMEQAVRRIGYQVRLPENVAEATALDKNTHTAVPSKLGNTKMTWRFKNFLRRN